MKPPADRLMLGQARAEVAELREQLAAANTLPARIWEALGELTSYLVDGDHMVKVDDVRRTFERHLAAQPATAPRLLEPVGDTPPPGCHCPPDRCGAPIVMGRQMPCRRMGKPPAHLAGKAIENSENAALAGICSLIDGKHDRECVTVQAVRAHLAAQPATAPAERKITRRVVAALGTREREDMPYAAQPATATAAPVEANLRAQLKAANIQIKSLERDIRELRQAVDIKTDEIERVRVILGPPAGIK